jgi:membrane fusion protein (multidrug efflux system)
VKVRALLDNEHGLLRAGMFLTVTLFRQDIRSLLIPEAAVVPERSQQFVGVVGDEGLAEFRPVKTGRRRPGEVEVLEGLQAGERVIVEGTQKARPGQAVEAELRQ